MQALQETCLLTLIMSMVLNSDNHVSIAFSEDALSPTHTWSSTYAHDDAKILLQLALMVTAANYTNEALRVPSWLQDITLVYHMCPTPVLARATQASTLGHVLYSATHNMIFIIFTGTSNTCLASLDVQYTQHEISGIANYTSGMKAHAGMYAAYLAVREQLWHILKQTTQAKIYITGHSLGGGLSQLCALDLADYDPMHYSFGSPLVFNAAAAAKFETLVSRSYRIANISDAVTAVPLPVMPNSDTFCHVGEFMYFQRNLGDMHASHTLSYVQEYNIPHTISRV